MVGWVGVGWAAGRVGVILQSEIPPIRLEKSLVKQRQEAYHAMFVCYSIRI